MPMEQEPYCPIVNICIGRESYDIDNWHYVIIKCISSYYIIIIIDISNDFNDSFS